MRGSGLIFLDYIANVNTFLNTITLHCPTLEQGRVPYPEGRVPQCKNGMSIIEIKISQKERNAIFK